MHAQEKKYGTICMRRKIRDKSLAIDDFQCRYPESMHARAGKHTIIFLQLTISNAGIWSQCMYAQEHTR